MQRMPVKVDLDKCTVTYDDGITENGIPSAEAMAMIVVLNDRLNDVEWKLEQLLEVSVVNLR